MTMFIIKICVIMRCVIKGLHCNCNRMTLYVIHITTVRSTQVTQVFLHYQKARRKGCPGSHPFFTEMVMSYYQSLNYLHAG